MTSEPRERAALHGESGFTIVEVMLAIVLLLVGVLGMLTMVEGSFTSTSRTTAREAGTNLVREVIERSREVPYAQTVTGSAPAALAAALPESPAVSGSSFVVRRRSFDYTVTVTACSIDDPADGIGLGDATFCNAPTKNTGPSSATGTGLAIGPNVLGLPVTLAAGGAVVETVCRALGLDTDVINAVASVGTSLLSAAGNGAQVTACASTTGSGSVAIDTKPDDLRRVRVRADWRELSGTPGTLTQTTLLTTPA